ncbi:hypothetical protein EDD86DRAFT_212214 [Gorgonomyces haynaldii]|nr:hypothetical protein EDD86DRAFT_212214 [Gorgonomyces haynaldii]
MSVDPLVWLQQYTSKHPSEHFNKFARLYELKLWHQLTLALLDYSRLPESKTHLQVLYDNFITDFEKRVNKVSLCQIQFHVASLLKPKEALDRLVNFLSTIENKDLDAHSLVRLEIAHYHLVLNQIEETKTILKEVQPAVEQLTSHVVLNASFYKVSADFHKTVLDYSKYFTHSLLFLSCVSLDELSKENQLERAHDLSIAALLGNGLYNFGQLLLHPILNTLNDSPYQWLRKLLFAFNQGDIDAFEHIIKSGDFLKQPLLVKNVESLRQKLGLMTLVEVIFKRSKESRGHIKFSEIAQETRIPVDQVEHLVMKALSLGLIKGIIDEVELVVVVSWVQPRVLSLEQVQTVRDRIAEWSTGVSQRVIGLENDESFNSILVSS